MKDKTIAIYVFLYDLLIKIGQKEPAGRKVFNSQIITTALVAGMFLTAIWNMPLALPKRWAKAGSTVAFMLFMN